MDAEIDEIIIDYARDKNLGKVLGRFFIIEFLKDDDFKFLKDIFPKGDNKKLFREWFVLEALAMTVAFSGSFKGSDEGAAITQIFNQTVGNELIRRGMFENPKEYVDFVRPRMDRYWQELAKGENSGQPNGLYLMSKMFCEDVNGAENIAPIMAIAEIFSDRSIANKKFIDSLMKV